MMTKRYVLFIIADDWSPIAGTYGDTVVKTPNIDHLSNRGTTFTNAFCTTPSCSASRACILTGVHSHTHGQYGHTHSIHGFSTHAEVPTIPSVLQRNRRHSALLGKNHTAPASAYPWTHKEWAEMTPQGVEASVRKSLEEAKFSDCGGMIMLAPSYPHRMGYGGWGLGQHTDKFKDPRYDLDQIPVPGFLPDTAAVRRDLAGYYGGISRFDTLVGAALRALTKSGLSDQTLIVVTSDHGMPFPGAKASCYDGGHHCPLIIHRPGQSSAIYCDAVISWLDFAPTIYEWLGVTFPATLQGRSLLPVLDQPNPESWDETSFSHNFHEVTMYDPYRVWRNRRFKYIRRLAHQLPLSISDNPSLLFSEDGSLTPGYRRRDIYTQRDFESLFDLLKDPWETRNLINEHDFHEVAEQMRCSSIAQRQLTEDPWLALEYRNGDPLVPDPPIWR